MKTSFYLIGLVLFVSLFSSCIKEPPCPRNLQKVEFVLDSDHVSLADFISMEPGDEVVIFEAEHLSSEQTDMAQFDSSNTIPLKYRFDGEAFIPVDGQCSSELGKADYYYCTKDTEQRLQVLMYDTIGE